MVQVNNTTQQSWREQTVNLNENAPTLITFSDTEPNYIVLQNPTSNTLYVGESANVSPNYYEMEIPAGGKKVFTKAKGMSQFYIWHADNIIESIPIVSFVDTFNPAMIDRTSETVNTQQVTGNVNVTTIPSIPGGSNHIGEVSINTMPEVQVKGDTANPLPVTLQSFQAVQVTANGDTIVKGSAGKIAGIKSDGTTVATVKDGATPIWSTTGESQFSQPIAFSNNLTINLSQAGTVYVIYV